MEILQGLRISHTEFTAKLQDLGKGEAVSLKKQGDGKQGRRKVIIIRKDRVLGCSAVTLCSLFNM
jgi:hypothetical protein